MLSCNLGAGLCLKSQLKEEEQKKSDSLDLSWENPKGPFTLDIFVAIFAVILWGFQIAYRCKLVPIPLRFESSVAYMYMDNLKLKWNHADITLEITAKITSVNGP